MTAHWETIWAFETARFKVAFDVAPETDLDLSWDETGEVAKDLEAGNVVAFVARVAVYLDGRVMAADYLGGCIYDSPRKFIDHRGIRAEGPTAGSYFSDMVRNAIGETRKAVASIKGIHLRTA